MSTQNVDTQTEELSWVPFAVAGVITAIICLSVWLLMRHDGYLTEQEQQVLKQFEELVTSQNPFTEDGELLESVRRLSWKTAGAVAIENLAKKHDNLVFDRASMELYFSNFSGHTDQDHQFKFRFLRCAGEKVSAGIGIISGLKIDSIQLADTELQVTLLVTEDPNNYVQDELGWKAGERYQKKIDMTEVRKRVPDDYLAPDDLTDFGNYQLLDEDA